VAISRGEVPSPSTPSDSDSRLSCPSTPARVPVMFRRSSGSSSISKRSVEPTALLRAMYILRGTHVRSLARRKPGVQIPSPPPHNSPGHRPGGLLSPGRCRSRVAGRAANGQQPRTKRPRCLIAGHDDVVKRGQDSRPSDCESVPTLPPGPAPDHPGCSGARAIPSSAVLWGLVLAPGLPERLPLSCVAPVNLP
jgi:hypothetical protein